MAGDMNICTRREGQMHEELIFVVQDALANAVVDTEIRKIIWADGDGLTIIQSAEKIKRIKDIELRRIINQIVAWLEMDYVPEGQSEIDDDFEEKVDEWLEYLILEHPEYQIQRS